MARKSDTKVGGELRRLPLAVLEPDALNPRLPPDVQDKLLSPAKLYPYLNRVYDVVSIAQSIARHGFFESEPLIAIPAERAYVRRGGDGTTKPKRATRRDSFVVVEGNRRLAALKGLTDLKARAAFEDPAWDKLPPPEAVELPDTFPTLVVVDRDRVAPILGYRHITGIAQWDPLPQAKYIADLIDDREYSFASVAELLNRPETEVRSYYRNYWIRFQAEDQFKLKDADRITEEFGVWTRAMQSPDIRTYISAPAPREVDTEYLPLPDDEGPDLARLVTWIFGKPRRKGQKYEARKPRPGQVITDSRQLTSLGRVLVDERGARALEKGATLKEAQEAMRDPVANLRQQLQSARRAVARIAASNGALPDDVSTELLAALDRAIEALIEHAVAETDS